MRCSGPTSAVLLDARALRPLSPSTYAASLVDGGGRELLHDANDGTFDVFTLHKVTKSMRLKPVSSSSGEEPLGVVNNLPPIHNLWIVEGLQH